MLTAASSFQKDIDDINKISIVPTLLNVICQTTGMGFAAIARVTEDKWLTCSVQDNVLFGLKPGDELQIKTTICNEVRQLKRAVVIDHVKEDPEFFDHHTPAMYGFQSYISVPITRQDGSFFGTLCAIDPKPNQLSSPAVTGMFNLFAQLISFHLNAIDEMEATRSNLEKLNSEFETFSFISSHDLQEPLRKIETFSGIILEKEIENLSDKGKSYFDIMKNAAHRMRMLITDLLSYSHTNFVEKKFEVTDLNQIITFVKSDLKEELRQKAAVLDVSQLHHARIIAIQFRQLLYNLVSNSLKFSSPERIPFIKIKSEIGQGSDFAQENLSPLTSYLHISVSDNGIGFEEKYNEQIFKLFQKLHGKDEFTGSGIGLTIVKRIVENHQGFITANGVLNEGATFDIYLPA